MFLAQPFALLNIMVKQRKARTRYKREVFSHLHAEPATPLPVPHTPPPLGLNDILCSMLQLEFLLKPWKKNQRYLREKLCAMPRTTSPLLRFSEISRDTTEAFPQLDGHPRSPERSLSTTPSCERWKSSSLQGEEITRGHSGEPVRGRLGSQASGPHSHLLAA